MTQTEKQFLVDDVVKELPYGVGHMIGLQSLDYYQGKLDALNDTLVSLDTIEMKINACYEKLLKHYEQNFL